ncbi:hypothetical protein JQX13_17040 [Archangium violaceum]|uniref:hypothetical protein n=1 Tax=Archangium violaceum TaxID=83451 RepID=UPI00193B3F00|nr:hypothetical protein [Archangium violaceum]QRK11622.1 hypothetical protein JQX13_17040 [Archangium violaceum]
MHLRRKSYLESASETERCGINDVPGLSVGLSRDGISFSFTGTDSGDMRAFWCDM